MTYSISHADFRVLLRVTGILPTLIQRLRCCKLQVTDWLLSMRNTKKNVLVIGCILHTNICPVEDFGYRSRTTTWCTLDSTK